MGFFKLGKKILGSAVKSAIYTQIFRRVEYENKIGLIRRA